MLISEFIERTGFTPTEDYYHTVIEPGYLNSNLDKDAYCKQWKKNGGIQVAYDAMCAEAANQYGRVLSLQYDVKTLNERIDNLKDECDRLNICKEIADAYYEEQRQLAEWLIEMSQKWGANDLRARAIHILGDKEYLSYKIENGITLWEADKKLIIELLNK